jgi:hypothetical protein
MLKQGKHSVGPFLMQCNVGTLTLCLSTSYVTSRAAPFAQIHPVVPPTLESHSVLSFHFFQK